MVNFAVSSLVNEFLDVFSGRISESDVRLNFSKEVYGGFIYSNKSTVVKLTKSEESKNSD